MHRLFIVLALLMTSACATPPAQEGGWFVLKWMEKPGTVKQLDRPEAQENQTQFSQIASYDPDNASESLEETLSKLHEGDVIAYRLGPWEARRKIVTGDLAKIGYRLFKYGHLAIVVHDPDDAAALRLFSSQSFRGANIREGLDSLQGHRFDVYRLEHAERIDGRRLAEFVRVAREKGGNVFGYDFVGMFGLWNSRLKPGNPEEVGNSYICSTVVATALYYAGVDMNVSSRRGMLDIVTPLQVVEGRGRFISPVEGHFVVESVFPETGSASSDPGSPVNQVTE